jgi:hypothetical protein
MGVEALEKLKFFIELRIFDRPLITNGCHFLASSIPIFGYAFGISCMLALIVSRCPKVGRWSLAIY